MSEITGPENDDSLIQAIGIGPTEMLRLRVSAAALARVTFTHPHNGQVMLAMERRATFKQVGNQSSILVAAKPFGGGVTIYRPAALLAEINSFHFDSVRSREEKDFRILIRPADWEIVREFCLREFRISLSRWSDPSAARNGILEADPARELAEEFEETLQVNLGPAQYRLSPLYMAVENEAVATESRRAEHLPTVRVYTVFQAVLTDPGLILQVLENSDRVPDDELARRARLDAQNGGRGRANAALALPVDLLVNAYRALPPGQPASAVTVAGHRLEGNVPAVLGEAQVPKYTFFPLIPGSFF